MKNKKTRISEIVNEIFVSANKSRLIFQLDEDNEIRAIHLGVTAFITFDDNYRKIQIVDKDKNFFLIKNNKVHYKIVSFLINPSVLLDYKTFIFLKKCISLLSDNTFEKQMFEKENVIAFNCDLNASVFD